MTLRVMIDIETLATKPGSAITQIAAVVVGSSSARFERYIDVDSCIKCGLGICWSTVMWRLDHLHTSARQELMATNRVSLTQALSDLLYWFYHDLQWEKHCHTGEVWSNGAAFDIPLLEAAYDKTGMNPPWSYKNVRCYRTIKALHPDIVLDYGIKPHDALRDAFMQANHLQLILESTEELGDNDRVEPVA